MMLKPMLTHAAVPLVMVALSVLASWGDQRMLERRTTSPIVNPLAQPSHLGIDSGILFILQ